MPMGYGPGVIAVVVGQVAAEAPVPEDVPGGYGEFLLTSMLVLVIVCVLAWVVLKFGLRRMFPGTRVGGDGPIRVVARLPLEPRQTLYIVEVGGKTLLIGSGDRPVNLVTELDADAVAEAVAAVPKPTSFADVLRRLARKDRAESEEAAS